MVELKYSRAPLARRFLALVIDTAIALSGYGLLVLLSLSFPSPVRAVVFVLSSAAFSWGVGYMALKDSFGGQGFGKRMTKLIVVNTKSDSPGNTKASVIRYLVSVGLAIIPFIGGFIEPIFVIANEHGRRIGDFAAGTQVVDLHEYQQRSNAGVVNDSQNLVKQPIGQL